MNINTTKLRGLGSLVVIALLTVGFTVVQAQAGEFHNREEFRYRYVSLSQAKLPPGFILFQPAAINNNGRIYGTAFDESSTAYVAVYKHGFVTTLTPGFAETANEGGTVGGSASVQIPPNNVQNQAALYRRDQIAALIPPLEGEIFSHVPYLNDSGTAVVSSLGPAFDVTWLLYKKGQTRMLDFGPDITDPSIVGINNGGEIAGLGTVASGGNRAFRYDSHSGNTVLLDPPSAEQNSWAYDINSRNVLVSRFEVDDTEHFGLWGSKGKLKFKTYYVFQNTSKDLVFIFSHFNDNNLIIRSEINGTTGATNSYLLPEPGVLLKLADLVINMPQGQDIINIFDINNRGDMIGISNPLEYFLLERLDKKGHASSKSTDEETLAPPEMTNERRDMSPAAEDILQKHIQQLKSGSGRHQDSLENLLLK